MAREFGGGSGVWESGSPGQICSRFIRRLRRQEPCRAGKYPQNMAKRLLTVVEMLCLGEQRAGTREQRRNQEERKGNGGERRRRGFAASRKQVTTDAALFIR